MKAKAIVGLARELVARHGGDVPRTIEELVRLPGVGRKTANVVLGVLWNKPDGVVVDTHVARISRRLGWTKNVDPEKIEKDIGDLLPRDRMESGESRAHLSRASMLHGTQTGLLVVLCARHVSERIRR